jgi:phosphopantetheinyl transferase
MLPAARAIASMEGSALATIAIAGEPDPSLLTEDERAIFATLTAERRRSEWWSGRIAARAALEAIGGNGLSILADERGAPRLDGAGAERFHVSISHGRRIAAGAATREDARFPCIGVDVVDPEDAARIAKISRRFLSAHEWTLAGEDSGAAMLAWGAREAIAKATSTGMFAFALKNGAIRAIDRAARRVGVEVEGIEVVFEPLAGDGLIVLAGTTRSVAERIRAAAGL